MQLIQYKHSDYPEGFCPKGHLDRGGGMTGGISTDFDRGDYIRDSVSVCRDTTREKPTHVVTFCRPYGHSASRFIPLFTERDKLVNLPND